MANKSAGSAAAESSSAATPEKKDAELPENASSATSDGASHIVNMTDKYLGRAIIITGAPDQKS